MHQVCINIPSEMSVKLRIQSDKSVFMHVIFGIHLSKKLLAFLQTVVMIIAGDFFYPAP